MSGLLKLARETREVGGRGGGKQRAEEQESQRAKRAVKEGERRSRKKERGEEREREGRVYPFNSTGYKKNSLKGTVRPRIQSLSTSGKFYKASQKSHIMPNHFLQEPQNNNLCL